MYSTPPMEALLTYPWAETVVAARAARRENVAKDIMSVYEKVLRLACPSILAAGLPLYKPHSLIVET